jgi:molecular chaperone DnaK (HSP70)
MVVDYLKKVKEATEKDLKQESFDKVYKLPREYIITVPAMWSEEAQDATRACAAEAFLGERDRIDEIQIVAEPEAAGIYALAEMPKLGLEEGDTFVICDAGGG